MFKWIALFLAFVLALLVIVGIYAISAVNSFDNSCASRHGVLTDAGTCVYPK